MKLAVCIPCFNEEKYIGRTLESLAAQDDRDFKIFLCDNGSSDNTAKLAQAISRKLGLSLEVITEPQKGTGAASDTAFRRAIAEGFEIIARTDADAIVATNWTAVIRNHFVRNPRSMASGVTGPIAGELNLGRVLILRFASNLASLFGLFRPSNYGGNRLGRYVMTNGNNLAIDVETFLAAGGFRRSKIEDLHEDRALVNDVRATSGKVIRVRAMRVEVSARRIQTWGLLNSLKWYANHSYRGDEVDVR